MSGTQNPICPYCGKKAELYPTGHLFYKNGYDHGPVYSCRQCDAWIGCYKGTFRPAGRLADSNLRNAKAKLSSVIKILVDAKMQRDQCSKAETVSKAYKWIAENLGLAENNSLIGALNIDECQRAYALCQPFAQKILHDSHKN